MVEGGIILVGAFFAALALTAWTRRLAMRHGILDHPNERSSHSEPTPRGGGLAIVISASFAIAGLAFRHLIDPALAVTVTGGGLLIAATGILDDRRSLPAGIRIFAHVAAAAWAVYMLGGMPQINFNGHIVSLGPWGDVAGIIAIVWVLNLFNFMDGIDGIAASEAVFVTGAGGALAIVFEQDLAVGYSGSVIAVTALAFLWWNWPPAKIFLGDVGSGYLGYVIAVIGFAAGRASPVAIPAWLILGCVFFADATTTLFVRLIRGERIHLPHRDHAYQRLAVRWRGHRPVVLSMWAVNVFALLPVAVLAFVHPGLAATLAALTVLCSLAMVLWIRAVTL
jgi:Fuc2NAc and GlcNAc transferase